MKHITTIIFAVFLLAASVHAQELPGEFSKLDFALQELYNAHATGKDVNEVVQRFSLCFDNGNVKVEVHHTGETFSAADIGFRPELEEYGTAKGWIPISKLKELEKLETVLFVFGVIDENRLFAHQDINAPVGSPGFQDMNMPSPEIEPKFKIDPILTTVISAYKDGNKLSDIAEQYSLDVKGNKIKVTIMADKNFNSALWNVVAEETTVSENLQQIVAYLAPEEIENIAKDSSVHHILHALSFNIPELELPAASKLSADLNFLIDEVRAGKSLKETAEFLNLMLEGDKVLVEIFLEKSTTSCKPLESYKGSIGKELSVKAYLGLDEIEEAAKCSDVLIVASVLKAPEAANTPKDIALQGDLTFVYIATIATFIIFVILGVVFVKKMRKVW